MKLKLSNRAIGVILLIVGIGLLVFTFTVSYIYLTGVTTPTEPGEESIIASFGGMLGPVILAGVRAVYLGLMVWVGSIILLRGINLLTAKPEAAA